jgi:hypothetical protein
MCWQGIDKALARGVHTHASAALAALHVLLVLVASPLLTAVRQLDSK